MSGNGEKNLLAGELRTKLEEASARAATYPVCLTARECLMLLAVAEAAGKFVATTTIYRQRKESRAEFEDMAVALLIAKGQV